MKLKDIYLPYLPAIIALVGAVLIAVGLFLGRSDASNETFQQLRFVGAGLAAIGVTDQFKTGQWLSNQNQPLFMVSKGFEVSWQVASH